MNFLKQYKLPILIVSFIIFIDQILKFWIKTNMMLGDEYHIAGNWFIIHFTENNGMAFGIQFGGETGKMILTIFRIIAVCVIGWYIGKLIKQKAHKGLIISISMIFAGAMGNIIDSCFYGIIFSDSFFKLAAFHPLGGGYGSFLQGKVVDMFYFPIIQTHFPQWFPIWGSEELIFFRPVFNIADSSISVGVVILLFFQKKIFPTDIK